MPNGTRGEAREVLQQERESRWRYVVRHPEFRRRLRELRALYQNSDPLEVEATHKDFVKKWGLEKIPFDILTREYIPDEIPLKNQFYETFCHAAPLCPPVQIDEGPAGFITPSGVHRGEFATITVDLSYPDNLLVAAIGAELKAFRGDGPRRRHHRDKTDEFLDVYDRAEKGESIATIASALNESPSTVKGRLRAALRKIYSSTELPSKWGLVLASFDAATHFATCSICRAANAKENPSPDEYCPQVKRFIDEESAGQRELTGFDTVRDMGNREGSGRAFDPTSLPED